MNERAAQFLLRSQNRDGGWGYRVQGMSYVEPTGAVLLAIAQASTPILNEAEGRGRDFLLGLQQQDGGWGIAAMDSESGWMTAWAMIALAQFAPAREAVARGAAWLIHSVPFYITDEKPRAEVRRVFKIDSALRGFSWQAGDASWVHPTALAIRALVAVGKRAEPRVSDGVEYLLDRAVSSGGWNIGNPWMIDKPIPATIQDTAVALLALNAMGIVDKKRVSDAVQFLKNTVAKAKTPAELAWASYALRDYGVDVKDWVERLSGLQSAEGSWSANPFITALAMLAQPSV